MFDFVADVSAREIIYSLSHGNEIEIYLKLKSTTLTGDGRLNAHVFCSPILFAFLLGLAAAQHLSTLPIDTQFRQVNDAADVETQLGKEKTDYSIRRSIVSPKTIDFFRD